MSIVIYVITWVMGMENIKRHTSAVTGCLAATAASPCMRVSLQPIGCTSALVCDVQRRCGCSCRLWRYI